MSGGVVDPSGATALPNPDVSSAALKTPTRRNYFTFRHLAALAAAVVLSASGMVSAQDFACVIFSIPYMYFISRVAFPLTSSRPVPPLYAENKVLNTYVLFAAAIGLLLPIAYIVEGVAGGDREGARSAAPHVFLLASQVFMEGLSFSGGFSLPVRVFVPVYYNSVRISSILEWIRGEFSKEGEGFGGSSGRLYVGRALAFANMALWSFNLFGFLLPFYLPKAFKMYYSTNTKVKD